MSEAVQTPRYATFAQRSAAAIIDVGVYAAAGSGVGVLLFSLLGLDPSLRTFVLYLAVLGTGWVYCSTLESSRRQATLGKSLLGIVVADSDGNRLSFPAASLRYFAKTVSAIPLLGGFVLAAFNSRRQALHDMLGSSVVLKRDAAAGTGTRARVAPALPVPTPPSAPPGPTATAPAPPRPASPATPSPSAPVRVMGVDESAAPASHLGAVGQGAAAGDSHERTMLIDSAYAQTMLVKPRRGWMLVTLSGPNAGRHYDLGQETRIGREPDNTIQLSDDKVSRHHAKIVQQPDGYVLSDLESSNGTSVDGERVAESRLLRPGAEITIGTTRLVLRSPDHTD
jgi:uncharacterized RDD family membrane protein YckC